MAVNSPDPNADPQGGGDDSWLAQQTPEVQQAVRSLRAENGKHRTQNKVLSSQLAKMGDAPATIRRLSVDLALAQRGDVDPKLTKFFLSEENALDDLDVSVDGWQEVLNDRVSDLAARNPQIKQRKGPPTTRSANPLQPPGPGDTNPGGQLVRSQLQGMKPEDVVKAFNEGSLDQMLGRQR